MTQVSKGGISDEHLEHPELYKTRCPFSRILEKLLRSQAKSWCPQGCLLGLWTPE